MTFFLQHPGEFRKLNLEFTTTDKSITTKELTVSGNQFICFLLSSSLKTLLPQITASISFSASVFLFQGRDLSASEEFRDLQSDDKFQGSEDGVRYATAEDLLTVSAEVVEHLIPSLINEGEQVSTQQESILTDLLFDQLAR